MKILDFFKKLGKKLQRYNPFSDCENWDPPLIDAGVGIEYQHETFNIASCYHDIHFDDDYTGIFISMRLLVFRFHFEYERWFKD